MLEKTVELLTWRRIYLLPLRQKRLRCFSQLLCEEWSPPPTCFLFIVDTTIEQHPHRWQFPCQSHACSLQHLHHRWGWQTLYPAGARPRPQTCADVNTVLGCFSSLVGSLQNSWGNHTDAATALVLVAQLVAVLPFSCVGRRLLVKVFWANSLVIFVKAVAPNNKTGMIAETLVLTRSQWGAEKPTGHEPICRI